MIVNGTPKYVSARPNLDHGRGSLKIETLLVLTDLVKSRKVSDRTLLLLTDALQT